jgi:hypothetical protein
MALYKLQETNIEVDKEGNTLSSDLVLHLYPTKTNREKKLIELGEAPEKLFKRIIIHDISEY